MPSASQRRGRGGSAQASSSSTSTNSGPASSDAPPFEVPGHEWDPVLKRFFKKNPAAEAAAAVTTPDSRPHAFSRVESKPSSTKLGKRKATEHSAQDEAVEGEDGEPVLPQINRWGGAGGRSHFQAMHSMRTGGARHRTLFNQTTTEQFANGLRSSAAYYFTDLPDGQHRIRTICSTPDAFYWAGFSNEILLATFKSHPCLPQPLAGDAAIYGPRTSDLAWTTNIKSTPSNKPTENVISLVFPQIQTGPHWLDDFLFGTYDMDVDRLDLIHGALWSIVTPSDTGGRAWAPSINKAAWDGPHSEVRHSTIRTAPWLPPHEDGRPRTIRAFACRPEKAPYVQIVLSRSIPYPPPSVCAQTLDRDLPEASRLPLGSSWKAEKWLVDFPALVTPSDAMTVEVSIDGKYVLAGLRNGTILFWDVQHVILEWEEDRKRSWAAVKNQNPGTLDTINVGKSRSGEARPALMKPTEIVPPRPNRVHHIIMASDQEFLVVLASGDILLYRFGSLNEGVIRTFAGHPPSLGPLGFAVHRKRRIFAAAGADGRVRMWRLDDSRPLEPVDEQTRPRIQSEEEMKLYGRSFFDANSRPQGESLSNLSAALTGEGAKSEEEVEAWWANTTSMTVVDNENSFVAGKAVHQVIFPSPPQVLEWVHRPIRDETALETKQLLDHDLNDARVDEPDVPALAVACGSMIWFFT
ncbi:hypothetical protein OC846_003354 [Tilletia horrida]|uniref:WD40 repeat-like protein n=1 Tax=Tilletia horrida TaxID=155126 RepID=A0AAN6GPW6_9BASI|nr:hypothetical protein OC846_003354 [Tilletia horrida]